MVSVRKNAIFSSGGSVKRACSRTSNIARSGATVRAAAAAVVQVEPQEGREEKKYIHVHHFKQTGLFGAWFNDPSTEGKKERLFFGSHLTGYLAARAQDRAALKYRPSAKNPGSIKLNFDEEDYALDEELRDRMKNEEFGDLLRSESRPTYNKLEQTPLLRYFMEEERILGHLPSEVPNEAKAKKVTPLKQYLTGVFLNRKGNAQVPDLSFLAELNVALSVKLVALSEKLIKLKLIKDPIPTVHPAAAPNAEPKDEGPQKERKRLPRQELRFLPLKFRSVAALNKLRAVRFSERIPAGFQPLSTTPVSTVGAAKPKLAQEVVVAWVPQRPNSKLQRPKRLVWRFLTEFELMAPGTARSKLQYKLEKASRLVTPGTARSKLQYKLQKVNITRSSEPTQTATLPAQVEEPMPDVEEKVFEVEEPMLEVVEESRKNSFNLFMLAAVATEEEPQVI